MIVFAAVSCWTSLFLTFEKHVSLNLIELEICQENTGAVGRILNLAHCSFDLFGW